MPFFKKLKEKMKKVEEKAKEVAEKELGVERPAARAPAEIKPVEEMPGPPQIEVEIEPDEALKRIARYMLDLMKRGGPGIHRVMYYFQEDVRSRAVWGAFEAMAKKRGMDLEGEGDIMDSAKYLDANLEALADEFMAEYQRHKAEPEKRGFVFPDLGRKESPLDSLIGVWEGKFWKYDIFSSWDYSEPPDVYLGENQIKISVKPRSICNIITQKQPLHEVEVEADFSLAGPPFFMRTRLKGEMTAEGEIRAEGTVDWGTELRPEAFLGFVPESQREAFKQMLRDPRAREEWVRRMEKETGKPREECERQLERMMEGKPMGARETPVEFTGKVNLRENKMITRFTGILCPKVPTEEITVWESEGGAMKIKMGNLYFTAYQERRKPSKEDMINYYTKIKGEVKEHERKAIDYIHRRTKDMPIPIFSDNLKPLEDNPKYSEVSKSFVSDVIQGLCREHDVRIHSFYLDQHNMVSDDHQFLQLGVHIDGKLKLICFSISRAIKIKLYRVINCETGEMEKTEKRSYSKRAD